MTKAAFLKEVRRQFESLSAEAQGVPSKRAFGREVFWWDGLTVLELERRLIGAIVPPASSSTRRSDARADRSLGPGRLIV